LGSDESWKKATPTPAMSIRGGVAYKEWQRWFAPTILTIGWGLVLAVAIVMIVRASTTNYSPDSWSYIDISRSLFSSERGLGEVRGTRDFVNKPWQNDSFPFLWPLVLWLGITFMGPSAPVGSLIFVFIWLATGAIFGLTARTLGSPSFFVPIGTLSLLAIPGYVNEGNAGRSIPLNILLMVTSLFILVRYRSSTKIALIFGILLGLIAANRFDSLFYGPLAIALALIFGILKVREAIVASLGWLVFPLLWITYSLNYLNGFYITDNGRVALSISPTFVTDWPDAIEQSDWSVSAFLAKMSENIEVVTQSLTMSYLYWLVALKLALLMGIALTAIVPRYVVKPMVPFLYIDGSERARPWTRYVISLFVSFLVMHIVLLLSTGYGDTRYWGTVSILMLESLVALSGVLKIFRSYEGATIYAHALGVMLATLPLSLAALGVLHVEREYRYVSNQGTLDARIVECLRDVQGVPIIVGMEAFRLPATTSLRTALPPNNASDLSSDHWEKLANTFGITAWLNLSNNPASDLPENAKSVLNEIGCEKHKRMQIRKSSF
jgi:hypothetical protein